MSLCINQSGTWRNITTQCVNQSGTWRKVTTGCINQSGTWRKFGFSPALGSSFGGGFLICQAAGVYWIVSPYSTEVFRTWYNRNDAVTTSQSTTGCTGWFVPSLCQLCAAFRCKSYWDCVTLEYYWTDTEKNATCAYVIFPYTTYIYCYRKDATYIGRVRALRCVTY